MSVQIYHDRAERSAAPKREIIEVQTLRMFCGWDGQRHDLAHNRHPGRGDPQMGG